MTRFEVPEPSREAVDALRDTKLRSHSFDEVKAMASLVLRVDVPRIVRAEVERALRFAGLPEGARHELSASEAAYFAARFGAAPERPGPESLHSRGRQDGLPTPSAPPKEWTKTEVWLSREEVERQFGVKVTPDGQTQAERDFIRASAEERVARGHEAFADPEASQRDWRSFDAARRVVEEAKG